MSFRSGSPGKIGLGFAEKNATHLPMRSFPSAVDRWLAVVLIGSPVGCVLLGLWLWTVEPVAGAACVGSGILTGPLILAFLPCRYILADSELLIRCGFLRQSIPYDRIEKVTPCRSVKGGPALSLNRLRIDHRGGSVLVSPKDRRGFLSEIGMRIPGGNGSSAARSGARAEEFAAEWLRREKKFHILSQNWRHKRDELDIVARVKNCVIFVEVRARSANALVSGVHSINKRKKEALRRCALAYLRQCRPVPKYFRFDIAEIELNNGKPDLLRHFENVPVFRKNDRPSHS